MAETSGPIELMLVVDDDVIDRFGCVLRHLCVGMMDELVRTTVVSRCSRPIEDLVSPARVVVWPRTIWPWRRRNAQEWLEEFELEEPQVIHCLSARLLTWARAWAGAWHSRLAVHVTDLVDVQQLAAAHVRDVAAIATTPSVERALLQACPQLHDWSRIIPIGIPAQREASCLADPDRVPAVVVAAPLTSQTGADRVLQALQTVVRSGQEVQLFFLSGGPAERKFRRMVEDLGIVTHVTFAGQIHDWSIVEEAIRGADFYIMPGVRRRFTARRLVAMSCGLAILAPLGTMEDYLIDGTTARLFDPNDAHQLTQTWLALLDDRGAARQLAETALDYARAHHQASTMATATAWVYRELLQARTPGGGLPTHA